MIYVPRAVSESGVDLEKQKEKNSLPLCRPR